MKRFSFVLGLLAFVPLVACSASPSSSRGRPLSPEMLTVRGTFSTAREPLDNARAVAIGADGRVFASYLDRHGAFTLRLPVGHAYRVVFANSRADGNEAVLGHLALRTSSGIQQLLGVRTSGVLDLGSVSQNNTGDDAGTIDPADADTDADTDAGTGTDVDADVDSGFDAGFDAGNIDNGDDAGDDAGNDAGQGDNGDYGCHQHDGEDNNVCQANNGDDGNVFPQHDPGDRCNANDLDDAQSRHNCEHKGTRLCANQDAGDDAGTLDDGGVIDGGDVDANADDASAQNGGRTGGHSGGGVTTGQTSGSTSGTCHVNSDCGAHGVCCGGVCHSR